MIKINKFFNKKAGKTYSLGLVLSGGAARGLAHLGVLKAMEEVDLHPEIISGVSAGALAGGLYADGKSPEEILEIFKENGFFDFARFTIPRAGFMSTDKLLNVLQRELKAKVFSDLNIPFFAAAANLNAGKIAYFSEGELAPRIVASASIPVLFQPKEIEGSVYVDGGVFDNLPRKPIQEQCKHLIGVHVNPTGYEEKLDSMISIASRTFHLTVGAKISHEKENFNLFIEPEELKKYTLLNISKADEIYKHGYETAQKALTDEKVRELKS